MGYWHRLNVGTFMTLWMGLSFGVLPGKAEAQLDPCAGALVRDARTVAMTSAETYALTQVIDRSLSSEEQSRLGVTVPINGVAVPLNSERARRLTSAFFSQTKVTWDLRTSISLVSQTLSERAVEAYRACIDGQHRSGPRAIVYDATPEQMVVRVSWFSAADAPTTADATYIVEGAKPSEPLKAKWVTGERVGYVFNREKGKDFVFVVNIGKDTDRIFVKYLPRVEVDITRQIVTHPEPVKPPIRMANDGTGRNQGPIGGCLDAPNYGEIDFERASIDVIMKVGALDHTTYARIVKADVQQVCWSAFLRPLAKEGGGDFRFRIRYPVHVYSFKILD